MAPLENRPVEKNGGKAECYPALGAPEYDTFQLRNMTNDQLAKLEALFEEDACDYTIVRDGKVKHAFAI